MHFVCKGELVGRRRRIWRAISLPGPTAAVLPLCFLRPSRVSYYTGLLTSVRADVEVTRRASAGGHTLPPSHSLVPDIEVQVRC
jgi:hypothetical protein